MKVTITFSFAISKLFKLILLNGQYMDVIMSVHHRVAFSQWWQSLYKHQTSPVSKTSSENSHPPSTYPHPRTNLSPSSSMTQYRRFCTAQHFGHPSSFNFPAAMSILNLKGDGFHLIYIQQQFPSKVPTQEGSKDGKFLTFTHKSFILTASVRPPLGFTIKKKVSK